MHCQSNQKAFSWKNCCFIFSIFDIPLVYKRLEVAAVFDALRRIKIDHLHLAGHPFLFQQGVHDKDTITSYQAVGPVFFVLIKINGFPQRFFIDFEQTQLLVIILVFLHSFNDGFRINAFVNMQAHRRHFKTGMLGFSSPLQLRVKVRVVLVCFLLLYQGHFSVSPIPHRGY